VLYTLWSAKGGSGATVTAALLALALGEPAGVLLVDLAGDLPGVLAVPDPPVGVGDLEGTDGLRPDALRRAEVPVTAEVSLLGRGSGAAGPAIGPLLDLLAADPRPVVVDAGTVPRAVDPVERSAVVEAVRRADRSLVVVRPCYLGVRSTAAALAALPATGCILLREPGRNLDADDVATVLGVPIVAEVHVAPSVARSVDAGLLTHRPDRAAIRSLQAAA
jgi:hypothetical protein